MHGASAWDRWAGVVAATLTAATDWAHGLQTSSAPYSADGCGAHSDGRATGGARQQQQQQQLQQQQQQRMQLCMQDAAFHLSKVAKLLLLPTVAGVEIDGLGWEPLPDLLKSLAGFCGITSEALQALVEVRGLELIFTRHC